MLNRASKLALVAGAIAMAGGTPRVSAQHNGSGGGPYGSGIIYGSGSFAPNVYRVNPNGTGGAVAVNFGEYQNPYTGWYQDSTAHPSYQLHGGKRWFAISAVTFPTNYDSDDRFAVIFKSDAGDASVCPMSPLNADLDNLTMANNTVYGVNIQWLPGDGGVTFAARSASTGIVGIYSLPVSWGTGIPVTGSAQLAIATASYQATATSFNLPPGIPPPFMSVVGEFTWNPAASAIAFRPGPNGNPLPAGLYTLTTGGIQTRLLTFTPSLCGWGYTDRICYCDSASLKTMKPDGTNQVTVASGKTGTSLSAPIYSPLADNIVFRWYDRQYNGLKTVPSGGGGPYSMNFYTDFPVGWR